jgi:hypothetical protein
MCGTVIQSRRQLPAAAATVHSSKEHQKSSCQCPVLHLCGTSIHVDLCSIHVQSKSTVDEALWQGSPQHNMWVCYCRQLGTPDIQAVVLTPAGCCAYTRHLCTLHMERVCVQIILKQHRPPQRVTPCSAPGATYNSFWLHAMQQCGTL